MFQKLLEQLARSLAEASIPYMVIGGQALLVYGEPRLTKDIDVTLGVCADALPRVLAALAAMKIEVLVPDPEVFVRRTMVLPVRDPGSGIPIDLIFSFSPYEQEAIGRAKEVAIGSTPVRFASLEDVVIHKIVAGRPRDIEDVRSILLKNERFDRAYIERWLAEFDAALAGNYREAFGELLRDVAP